MTNSTDSSTISISSAPLHLSFPSCLSLLSFPIYRFSCFSVITSFSLFVSCVVFPPFPASEWSWHVWKQLPPFHACLFYSKLGFWYPYLFSHSFLRVLESSLIHLLFSCWSIVHSRVRGWRCVTTWKHLPRLVFLLIRFSSRSSRIMILISVVFFSCFCYCRSSFDVFCSNSSPVALLEAMVAFLCVSVLFPAGLLIVCLSLAAVVVCFRSSYDESELLPFWPSHILSRMSKT